MKSGPPPLENSATHSTASKPLKSSRLSAFSYWCSAVLLALLVSSCRDTLSLENLPESEKIKDGTVRKIAVTDPFVWMQSDALIESGGDESSFQSFKVQIRSMQDSILWASIRDGRIGVRIGKAIVIGDSAAFSSTLIAEKWAGSASDLAQKTGIEIPFLYLNRLLRGQLIGTDETLKYMYNEWSESWVAKYELEGNIHVKLALNRALKMKWIEIAAQGESLRILYDSFDELTGYPTSMKVQIDGALGNDVVITISDIRTGGPLKTPFSW